MSGKGGERRSSASRKSVAIAPSSPSSRSPGQGFNVLLEDKWDFDADDHFALIEPGLSVLVVERHLGLSTSLEIPLDDDSYNHVAKVGMVWFY